jgi:hypothetical protein
MASAVRASGFIGGGKPATDAVMAAADPEPTSADDHRSKESNDFGHDRIDVGGPRRIDRDHFSYTHRLIELGERAVVYETPRMRRMNAGSTPRNKSASHHARVSHRLAFGRTPKNFHSGRALMVLIMADVRSG